MNEAQFKLITKKLKIKPERLQAIRDVTNGITTSTPAETKYGLTRGVIQRDVDRVVSLYSWAKEFSRLYKFTLTKQTK